MYCIYNALFLFFEGSMNEVTEGIRSPRRSEQMPQYSKRQHIGLSDDCFSVTVESCQDDFDFEKNLAMFDKQKASLSLAFLIGVGCFYHC